MDKGARGLECAGPFRPLGELQLSLPLGLDISGRSGHRGVLTFPKVEKNQSACCVTCGRPGRRVETSQEAVAKIRVRDDGGGERVFFLVFLRVWVYSDVC